MTSLTPKVSVIVPYHNGFETLNSCLQSVFDSDYPDKEVIVVDDASTDSGAERAKAIFKELMVVTNERNLGYGGSCNAGAAKSQGEYLVFLNSDTEVMPTWLSHLIRVSIEHDAQVATPRILFTGDKDLINAAGGSCDILGVGWNRGNGFKEKGQFLDPEYVFYGSACLLVRRDVWFEMGGFDESYFMYFEDVDFCWRCKLGGYETLYIPSSVIYHQWRETTKDPYFIASLVFRNHLRTILKNYSVTSLCMVLPVYFLLKVVELAYFSIKSKKMANIVVSGLMWNLRNLNTLSSARSMAQDKRRVRDSRIIERMSSLSVEFHLLIGNIQHPLRNFLLDPSHLYSKDIDKLKS